MAYPERHYIIIPVSLAAIANAEAQKWDPDVGGASTFGGAGASSDDGATRTHLVASTLMSDQEVLPGATGMQILEAFYATAHYAGYRIRRGEGDTSALIEGEVEALRLHPLRWEVIGTGNLAQLALADAGLVAYVEEDEDGGSAPDEWQAGVSYVAGQIVTYQGAQYECITSHTSQVGWTPAAVPALWRAL